MRVDEKYRESLIRDLEYTEKETDKSVTDICGADNRLLKLQKKIKFVDVILKYGLHAEPHFSMGVYFVYPPDGGKTLVYSPNSGKWKNKGKNTWYRSRSPEDWVSRYVLKNKDGDKSMMQQLQMNVDEWICVNTNPIQRNTEAHAKTACKKHLSSYSPTHARVSAARFPNGEMYKLDGHTRALLWEKGVLKRPNVLYVDVYNVENMDEVKSLYKQFDNVSAVETSKDKVQGAYRQNHFVPESSLVKNGPIVSSISTIKGDSSVDVYKEVTRWIDTLRIIDQHFFPKKGGTTPILAAMMVSVEIYGDGVIEFWKKFFGDEGWKSGRTRDPVQALSDVVLESRLNKTNTGAGANKEILSKSLSCVERYMKDEVFNRSVRGLDLRDYLKTKGII